MFFKDHEKAVYAPPGHPAGDAKFDPLALDRALVRATGGKLADLLRQHAAGSDGLGDVSPEGQAANALMSADAEEQLVRAARAAFALPDFPACTDGAALDLLWHYLAYMEGKGSAGATPPASPAPSDSRPAA